MVPALGWRRDRWFDESGLPWVRPSPNMPSLTSALLYPAIVALMRWADRHMAPDEDAIAVELVHRACGEPTHPYLACSHCHEPLTARDIEPQVG